jgi:hypothetical protein
MASGDRLKRSVVAPSLFAALPLTGFGVWALLGSGLALNVYPNGRGEVLVPLTFGLLCVLAGLLYMAPRRGARPTRESLLAMATFLPMLAVAGLARGDNDFWATRLAAAALAVCSVVTLCVQRTDTGTAGRTTLSPANVLAALFSGGLWLWLCIALQQQEVAVLPTFGTLTVAAPWRLLLMLAGVALGVLEYTGRHRDRRRHAAFTAALLFALPCVLLAWSGLRHEQVLPALLAALSCEAGLWLLQRLPHPPAKNPYP